MIKDFTVVSFPGLVLTNNLATVGGLTVPSGWNSHTLVAENPLFFIGSDLQGNGVLCCIKGTDGTLDITDAASNTITGIHAPSTVQYGVLFGGHPIHRPR